jgi:hypothetical protein
MAAKKNGGDFYAWSDIYYGGKSEKMTTRTGAERTVITERNIVHHGDKVSQSKLGVTDEQWQTMIDGGSVREYPVPEGVDEHTSPHRAVMSTLVNDDGDIDVDKLLALGAPSVAALTTLPAPINPPAEEGKTLGEDKPAGA